jgi:hypothetical protein
MIALFGQATKRITADWVIREGDTMPETKKLTLYCSGCRAELHESALFEFLGSVGCESCVRNYYRNWPSEVIAIELQTRRTGAVAWLKRNRKTLEKSAASAAA